MKAGSSLNSLAIAALFVAPLALSPGAATPASAASGAISHFVSLAAPARAVDLSVHLPLRNTAQLDQLIELQTNPRSPLFHHFLSVAQFRAAFAPTTQTLTRAAASLRARGFAVTGQTSQSLHVRATAANVERAFGTRLGVLRDTRGTGRVAAMRPLRLTPELSAMGAVVTGLEKSSPVHTESRQVPLNRYRNRGPYWFTDLKEAYTYPSYTKLNGTGVGIGIVMSSDVLDSDTKAAFDHEHFSSISGAPVPSVIRRPVEGGAGVGGGAFDEASIDVQTSLGSAPGATAVLYDIPDLGLDSILAAYEDVDNDDLVSVVSSSFGACELAFTAAYNGGQDFTGLLRSFHELFEQGNSEGITFVASSGDEAGLECPNVAYFTGAPGAKFIPSVSFPANDPNVTGVGGTNLVTTTPPNPVAKPPNPDPTKHLTSKYVSENDYGDAEIPQDPYGVGENLTNGYWGSGSGVSKIWAKPSYQRLVNTGVSGRAVPDVSMQMGGCPSSLSILPCNETHSASFYYVDGTIGGFIGTSLSSPEFAGLLALKVEETGSRLGNVNPLLYELSAKNATAKPFQYFHQNIPGYNGVVRVSAASKPYNPIVGVGTPNARMFLGVPQIPLALDPWTPSNP